MTPAVTRYAALVLLASAHAARAQPDLPAPVRDVALDQKLDSQVPLDAQFRDETGRVVSLAGLMHGRPVILTLNYYRCPMLCTLVLNGLLSSLRVLSFDVARDFDVITISIDPRETPDLAAAKKREYVAKYGRDRAAEGWRFLTADEPDIRRVADAVGFRYAYDPKSGQYAHASGIILLTPQGRVSRYFYGIEYSPRDLRLGLVEASHNRIGSAVDQILLLCFHYDPLRGKYGFAVMSALRLGGIATLGAIVIGITVMIRRDRRRRAQGASPAAVQATAAQSSVGEP